MNNFAGGFMEVINSRALGGMIALIVVFGVLIGCTKAGPDFMGDKLVCTGPLYEYNEWHDSIPIYRCKKFDKFEAAEEIRYAMAPTTVRTATTTTAPYPADWKEHDDRMKEMIEDAQHYPDGAVYPSSMQGCSGLTFMRGKVIRCNVIIGTYTDDPYQTYLLESAVKDFLDAEFVYQGCLTSGCRDIYQFRDHRKEALEKLKEAVGGVK